MKNLNHIFDLLIFPFLFLIHKKKRLLFLLLPLITVLNLNAADECASSDFFHTLNTTTYIKNDTANKHGDTFHITVPSAGTVNISITTTDDITINYGDSFCPDTSTSVSDTYQIPWSTSGDFNLIVFRNITAATEAAYTLTITFTPIGFTNYFYWF